MGKFFCFFFLFQVFFSPSLVAFEDESDEENQDPYNLEAARLIQEERFEELHTRQNQARSTGSGFFRRHLEEAIESNRRRKPVYEALSQGVSSALSRDLILSEEATLVPARLLDAWARRFQTRGIPILQNDFVSMSPLPDPRTPPRYRGRLDAETRKLLEQRLRAYRGAIRGALKKDDFLLAARLTRVELAAVRDLEKRQGCHLAMTRHLLESVGFAALHAPAYARASGGETLRLSRAFVFLQAAVLPGGLLIDRRAHASHARGVGILVNDLPAIPFEKELEATLGR